MPRLPGVPHLPWTIAFLRIALQGGVPQRATELLGHVSSVPDGAREQGRDQLQMDLRTMPRPRRRGSHRASRDERRDGNGRQEWLVTVQHLPPRVRACMCCSKPPTLLPTQHLSAVCRNANREILNAQPPLSNPFGLLGRVYKQLWDWGPLAPHSFFFTLIGFRCKHHCNSLSCHTLTTVNSLHAHAFAGQVRAPWACAPQPDGVGIVPSVCPLRQRF